MKEYKYTINGNKYEVVIGDIVENIADVKVNGEDFKVEMEKPAEPEKPVIKSSAATKPVASSEGAAPKAGANKANAIKAPLPGVITEIRVNEGDEVQAGDVVIVLEAMKMANNLTADKAGKVTAICVGVGESVMEDDALVVIE